MNFEILDMSILWEEVNRYSIVNGNRILYNINVVTRKFSILEKRVVCYPGCYGFMFCHINRVARIYHFLYVSNILSRSQQHCRGG